MERGISRFQHGEAVIQNLYFRPKFSTMPDFSQSEMFARFSPVLDAEGVIFQKKQNVFAKKAEAQEVVTTQTSDGVETVNTAETGDYLVKNQTAAGEVYVVKASKFAARYEWFGIGEGGFEEYRPTGRVTAVELTPERCEAMDLPDVFHFEAPWGEAMVAKTGDFIVSPPDGAEVYRIARKEFFETYAEVE